MATPAEKLMPKMLETRRLDPNIGVEIVGLDVGAASEEALSAFDHIVARHPVVVVRGQSLTPAQIMDLSSRLGKVSVQHRTGPHPDYPGISVLSNKIVDGKPIGIKDVGRSWHTDGTTYAHPGLTTMLYGVECPPEGADTLIADAARAYEDLTPDEKAEVDRIQVVHNRAHLIKKYNRAALADEEIARMQDVIHPAVVRSPVDGRRAFYLTNGSTKGVVGMADEAGVSLVKKWIAHVTQPKYVYAHKWRAGDILIWNDMCTMHSATSYDESKYDRLVYRAWIRPFDLSDRTSTVEESLPAH